jgi:hypothetical protein
MGFEPRQMKRILEVCVHQSYSLVHLSVLLVHTYISLIFVTTFHSQELFVVFKSQTPAVRRKATQDAVTRSLTLSQGVQQFDL